MLLLRLRGYEEIREQRRFLSRPHATGSWQKGTSPLTTNRTPSTYRLTTKEPTNKNNNLTNELEDREY